MDKRSFQIKIKGIKSDLDAAVDFHEMDDLDRTEEYLEDCLTSIKNLKNQVSC